MTEEKNMGTLAVILAIVVALVWGGNFAASKYALLHFPPFYVIFIRYLFVTLLLLPFAKPIGLSKKQLFILSLLTIGLHFTLVFAALWLGLDIGTTVVVIQLGAPFSCLLGVIFLKDYLGPWRTLGMVVAFIGIIVVAGTPNVSDNWWAFVLAIAGASAWAASNVYMKTLGPVPVMPLLFWTGLFSLPQTLLVSLLIESDHLTLLQTAPWTAWTGIAYSGMVSTIVGYGVWYWLLRNYHVSQVTPYSLLVPVGGFTSGIVFFGEELTMHMLAGAAITIAGVAIITVRRPKLMPSPRA